MEELAHNFPMKGTMIFVNVACILMLPFPTAYVLLCITSRSVRPFPWYLMAANAMGSLLQRLACLGL